MSVTGLDLRGQLRRGLVTLLDAVAARLEAPPSAPPPEPPPAAEAPPAAEPPKPAPEPVRAAPPPPLPELPKPAAPKRPAAKAPKRVVPTEPEPVVLETPAAAKAAASPEDRQKQHWERTRKGLLRFVGEKGGSASLRDLHDHSERTYFVAHVGFSRMMEELTGEGLLDYDQDTAVATLTDAGRALAEG